MLLLGCTVAVAVQVVGALLVLALLCTPAAAAARVTTSPVLMPVLSVGFALVSMRRRHPAGARHAIPISPYVTTISFLLYLVARGVAALTADRGRAHHAEESAMPVGDLVHD